MPAGRGGKFGDRKGGAGGKFGERRDDRGPRGARRRGASATGRRSKTAVRGWAMWRSAPSAKPSSTPQLTLKKLAAQAHGEALTQLMTAWEQRAADQVPSLQELGKAVTPAVRSSWVAGSGCRARAAMPSEALLRLEIAAEAPTPAEHLNARRALQLQLLTRRNDPSPAQTWGQDAAQVLAVERYDAGAARRLQNALKTLLRR